MILVELSNLPVNMRSVLEHGENPFSSGIQISRYFFFHIIKVHVSKPIPYFKSYST